MSVTAAVCDDPGVVSVVRAVLRRLGPQLVEATLVPSLACWAGAATVGLGWGVAAASLWLFGTVGFRVWRGRKVSGLLVLATVGLLARCVLFLLSGSAFVYFAQPIARSVLTAAVFGVSALTRRPMVARFAGDFCHFTVNVAARPAIAALFRRLTLLWAAGQLVAAAATFTLLVTLPATIFIGTAAGAALLVISVCLIATVVDAIRTTRRDGLRTLIDGGRLYALAPDSVAR